MVCPTGLEVYPAGHTRCPTHNVTLTAQNVASIVGQVVNGRYEIKESISWGGWASIYRALDRETNSEVALKVMHSYLLADAEAVARFKREAKAASGLSNPCLAQVYDAGVLPDGQPFLAMEYVKGITLAERIATLGALTAEQAIPLFVKTCDALSAAHQKGIIHRDIKPSNLMLAQAKDGELEVKLVDFGLARAMENSGLDIDQITRTGQTLGSPAYMSPEQCLGYKLDARSDVYSLGCTMYEAVSGKPPFTGASILEYMHKHTYEEPPALEIRSDEVNFGYNFLHVIMQALAKNPAERQQSMAQLRDQLQACMWQAPEEQSIVTSLRTKAVPEPAPQKPPPKPNRVLGWISVLAPVFLVVLLICAFVYVLRQGNPQDNGPDSSSPAAQQEKSGAKPSNKPEHNQKRTHPG